MVSSSQCLRILKKRKHIASDDKCILLLVKSVGAAMSDVFHDDIDNVTYIDAGVVGFTRLSSDLPNGLLMTEQFQKADFLVCTNSGSFAVCLEPVSGYNAFKLDEINDAWRGCFVTGVQLQTDLSSAFNTNQKSIRAGDLVIIAGSIFIASRSDRVGYEPNLVKWADGLALGSGSIDGGFSRWRVVLSERNSVRALKEIDSEA